MPWPWPAGCAGTGGGTVSTNITGVGAAHLQPRDLEDNTGRAAAFDVSSNRRYTSHSRERPVAAPGRSGEGQGESTPHAPRGLPKLLEESVGPGIQQGTRGGHRETVLCDSALPLS